jgi:ribosome maturation factor RimP
MRPYTKFKKISDEHVEKTDELTGEVKILNVDELTNELEQYVNNLHSDNYKELIGDLNESKKKLSLLFVNYTLIIDGLIDQHDEDIYFLDSGCIWQDFTITTEEGENITLLTDSPHEEIIKYKDDVRRAISKEFDNKKMKADNYFLEITSKIDRGEKINFSEMLETLKEINTKVTRPKKTQWVLDAIEEGKLEKDGKTLRVSADDMAEWLFLYGVEGVDTNFMLNNFRLRMKHSTAQQAASRGKPEFVKKEKKTKK